MSFESATSAQADNLQEVALNYWDNTDAPSLLGLNDFQSDLFFPDSELNENIFHIPPNDLVQLNEFGDYNENYVLSHEDERTVANDAMENNFIPAANDAFQAYQFKLEPVSISGLNERHPNVNQYHTSGSDNPQFAFKVNEFVNFKPAPSTTGHDEQPTKFSNCGEDQFELPPESSHCREDQFKQPPESSNCGEDQLKPKHEKSTHKCDICGFTSSKRYLLARHVKSHFMELTSQFKCHLFHKVFNGEPSLKRNSLKETMELKSHSCTLCSSKFPTAHELRRHIKYKHTHEKNFKCALCDYAAVEKGKVKRHMACHTGERPHQCKDCSMAFPTFFNLKRHIRTHTMEKPYQCEICSATFAQWNTLQGHRKIHTYDKPAFKCDVCPSTCGRKVDLINHYKHMHTSDTPVHCDKCGKVFKDLYSLKLHKKEHETFSCSLCTFSCTSLSYFKKHSNTHTDLKTLKCDLCEEFFYVKGRLKNHQILAHTEFKPLKKPKCKRNGPRVKCHHCVKTFSSEGNLQRHLRILKMTIDSDGEALKRETALKLDKVIDEMLGRETNVTTQENDDVLNSDDTTEVLNSDEVTNQEVLKSDTDHGRSSAEVVKVEKITNNIMEFDFDSDNESSEEVGVQVKNDTDNKSKDFETCFGFNEYF